MEQWIRTLTGISLSASILAAAILVLRALFAPRLKSWAMAAMWIVLAVRLTTPYMPQSPLSLFRFAPEPLAQTVQTPQATPAVLAPEKLSEPDQLRPVPSAVSPQHTQNDSASPAVDKIAPSVRPLSAWQIWFCVWLLGLTIMLGWILGINLRFRAVLKHNRVWDDPFFDSILRSACSAVGLPMHRQIRVIAVGAQTSPAVFGIFRPKLLIPVKSFDQLRIQDKHHVLCHELTHIKYHDLLWQALALALLCLHWFNPLLWLAYLAFRRDVEALCDRRTARLCGHTAAQYADSLLSVARTLSRQRQTGLLLAAMDTKKSLRWRLRMLMQPARWTHAATAAAAAGVIAALLAGCAAGSISGAAPSISLSPTPTGIPAAPTQGLEPVPAVQPGQEASLETLPIPEDYHGTLFTLPEQLSLNEQARYQTYPDDEQWSYQLVPVDAQALDPTGVIQAVWARYGVDSDSALTMLKKNGSALFLHDLLGQTGEETIRQYGHDEVLSFSDDYTVTYLWGTDFTKSDPIAYSSAQGSAQEVYAQYSAQFAAMLGLDNAPPFDAVEADVYEISGITQYRYILQLNADTRPLRGEFVVYGDGVTQAYIHASDTMEVMQSRTGYALTLEQALYSLNYNRAYFTQYGSAGNDGQYTRLIENDSVRLLTSTDMEQTALLTAPDARIADVSLRMEAFQTPQTWNAWFSQREYGAVRPVFEFTVESSRGSGVILVDCETGNLRDSSVSNEFALILSPYPQVNGESLAPDGQNMPVNDQADQAGKLIEQFLEQVWTSFMTLQSPQLPDCALDTPPIHLYLRWADHRIAELSHPLNAASRLAAEPQVQASAVTVMQDGDVLTVSCWVEIGLESSGSGVNGMQFEATAVLSPTPEGLRLTDFLPDYHYPTYQSLRRQFDEMDQPTVQQVDEMVDYAIDYFMKNNP